MSVGAGRKKGDGLQSTWLSSYSSVCGADGLETFAAAKNTNIDRLCADISKALDDVLR